EEREHDHDEHHDVDVTVDVRHRLTEKIPRPRHADDPSDSARNIVEEEPPIRHLADAGNDGRERTDDGNEARDDDRLRAVTSVEATGALDVGGVEGQRFLTREEPGAEAGAG